MNDIPKRFLQTNGYAIPHLPSTPKKDRQGVGSTTGEEHNNASNACFECWLGGKVENSLSKRSPMSLSHDHL